MTNREVRGDWVTIMPKKLVKVMVMVILQIRKSSLVY